MSQGGAPPSNDTEALVAQISRFTGSAKERLFTLACTSPRVAQLAFSFPLVLATLGQDFASFDDRQRAITLAVDGAPLDTVAAALGIPFCLRRLPPEACGKGCQSAWSGHASRLLAPYIPEDPIAANAWFAAISFAHTYGDEATACWVARRPRLLTNVRIVPRTLLPIILFAWHERRFPELVPGAPHWSQATELKAAVQRTVIWLKILKAQADLGEGIEDDWVQPCTSGTLTLEPLTTPAALLEEGQIMQNCVIEYAEGIARNICRIYSVRKNGHRIATLELRRHAMDGRPLSVQALGPGNWKLPLEINRAIFTLVGTAGKVIPPSRLKKFEGAA